VALPLLLAAGAFLNKVSGIAQALGSLGKGVKDSLPKCVERVTVTVFGGPTATRKDLYRLAMAIVWGKIQRRDALRLMPPGGSLVLSYDLEAKSVTVECQILTTYAAALVGRLRKSSNRTYEIFTGPAESVVGGEWAFTSVLPGLPGSPLGMDTKNGFEGRTLLTSDGTYTDKGGLRVSRSPTPQGDKISRGLATIARNPSVRNLDPKNWNNAPDILLFAALSEPCGAANLFSPVYAPPPAIFAPPESPTSPASLSSGTPMYSDGTPSAPSYPPPTMVVDNPTPPEQAPPPHAAGEKPTTLTTSGYPAIPPGNPAGIPIFDGGAGNQAYNPDN
jgi:hypothetical protein